MPHLIQQIENDAAPRLEKQIPDIPHNQGADDSGHIDAGSCNRFSFELTVHQKSIQQADNVK